MLPDTGFQVCLFVEGERPALISCPAVTEDLVRYMYEATRNGNTFLTDDPQWAIDFAPNGMQYRECLHLHSLLTITRYTSWAWRAINQKTIRKVSMPTPNPLSQPNQTSVPSNKLPHTARKSSTKEKSACPSSQNPCHSPTDLTSKPHHQCSPRHKRNHDP